jgi:sulfur relay protein TusB/DsrH
MIVIVRSGPDTPEGKRALKLAQSTASDIVLTQNGAYFLNGDALEGFYNVAYILEDDMKLRGLKAEESAARLKTITYDGLVDLMAEADKVIGMF